jgi:lipopolysaccharide export system protein LptC
MTTAAAGIWEPRRRASLANARRSSAFLRVFRQLCAALSGACIAALVLGVVLNAFGPAVTGGRTLGVEETLTMLNPRFVGQDSNGSQYEITAERAVRQGLDTEKMDLTAPVFETASGQSLSAKRGLYDPDQRTIELFDAVVFADPAGRKLTTSYAFIDARSDLIKGARAISGASGLGEVRADAYEVHSDGSRLFMRGRVRGVINAGGGQSADAP